MTTTLAAVVDPPFPVTFPLEWASVVVQVEDYDPVYFRSWSENAHSQITNMSSIFYQMEPVDQVNPAYYETWQNQPTTLMPIYDPRFFGGDIGNMPYWELLLFPNTHFAPNASGDFAEPSSFDITVKSGEFEIRRPL